MVRVTSVQEEENKSADEIVVCTAVSARAQMQLVLFESSEIRRVTNLKLHLEEKTKR